MSEIQLNLIDRKQILQGTIHGSILDACVAALTAEPESIEELETALTRFVRRVPSSPGPGLSATDLVSIFASFHTAAEIETRSWDAGVAIIDLAARVVAAESSYSQPQNYGEVHYHDGAQATDITLPYRVSDEWTFLSSLAEYPLIRMTRIKKRALLLDARLILYGRPLLEFIVRSIQQSSICRESIGTLPAITTLSDLESPESEAAAENRLSSEGASSETEETQSYLAKEISAIHACWLLTSRDDLEGESPRDVLLAKRELIDFDLYTRELQWSLQGEGPTCLAKNSAAYQFGGFGTHEIVTYHDLVRHLLWSALSRNRLDESNRLGDFEAEVARLDQIRIEWLENPQADYGGRTPANIIELERRRLPLALNAKEMIIDENCEVCVWSAQQAAMGHGPAFWHLDGSHMDEEFAFSFCRTRDEWDEENRRREEFNQEFNRRWQEREQRLTRGESVEDEFNLDWIDSVS